MSLDKPKKCKECGITKDISEFYKHKKMADGHFGSCKVCMGKRGKEWFAANRDKARAYSASWRAANPDRQKELELKYREKNRERCNASCAAWRKANPDAYRSSCRVSGNNRRAQIRKSGGRLSAGLADKLHSLQRGMCACGCKQPLGDDYHLDHIMPIALGGTNTDDNIQLLRAVCNKQKHAKHPVEFMQQRGFLV